MNDLTLELNIKVDELIKGVSHIEEMLDRYINKQKEVQSSSNDMAETILKDFRDIGMAFTAVIAPINQLWSSFDKFIQASNAQELSLQKLTSALRLKGEASKENIKSYDKYASQIQRLTNVQDDEVLGLLSIATSYGVVESKRREAVEGAIGLSRVYGVSLDSALKAVTFGMNGEWMQLQRLLPDIKLAGTETEKFAQFQKQLADSYQIAKDQTNTSAGAMLQLQNQVGDLHEVLGDMIKDAILPFVSGLTEVTKFLNEHPGLFKVIAVAVGSLAVSFTALTTAITAYASWTKISSAVTLFQDVVIKKLTITTASATVVTRLFNAALRSNPIILLASLVLTAVAAIATLATVFGKGKKASEDFNDSLNEIPTKKEILFDITYGDEWMQLCDNLNKRTATLEDHYQKEKDINEAHYNSNLSQMEIAKRDERSMLSQKYLEQYAELKKKYKKDKVLLQQYLAEAHRTHQEGLAKINADFLAQTAKLQEEVAEVTRQLDSKYHAEKKSAELSRQKELYDTAKKKFDLEIIGYDEMKKAMDNYYNWVAERYNKNSKEYLEAYSIKFDAQQKETKNAEEAQKKEQEKFHKAIAFAEQKKQLELTNYMEIKKITDEYYEYAKLNYQKDSENYIEALTMKRKANLMYAQEIRDQTQILLQSLNTDIQRNQLGLLGFDDLVGNFDTYLSKLQSSSDDTANIVNNLKQNISDLLNMDAYDNDVLQNMTLELEEAEKVAFDLEIQIAQVNKQLKDINDDKIQLKFDVENDALNLRDPIQAQLEAQKFALEKFYSEKKGLLEQAGLTEMEIETQKQEALNKLETEAFRARIDIASDGLNTIATAMEKSGKTGFEIAKQFRIADIIMTTPSAAMKAYDSLAMIPVVGTALGSAAFAATIAMGAMQIKEIMKAKPPKAEKGGLSGLLKGASHSQGGIIIEAEGDEYITNKKRVKELGTGFFDFINFAPLQIVRDFMQGLTVPKYSFGGLIPSFADGGIINTKIPILKVPQLPSNTFVSNNNMKGLEDRLDAMSDRLAYNLELIEKKTNDVYIKAKTNSVKYIRDHNKHQDIYNRRTG